MALGTHSQKQVVLLAERARVDVADGRLHGAHVGISDFGHGGEQEQDDQEAHEAGHAQVDPLHVLQALFVVDRLGKEDARGEQGRGSGADLRRRQLET